MPASTARTEASNSSDSAASTLAIARAAATAPICAAIVVKATRQRISGGKYALLDLPAEPVA